MSWVRSPSPAPLSASSRGLYPSVTTLLFGAQNPGRTVTRIFVPLFRPSTDSGTPRRTALRSRSTFGNQPFIWSELSRSSPFEIDGSRTCRLTYLPCALRTDVPISIRPITYSAPPVPRSPDTPDLGESPVFGVVVQIQEDLDVRRDLFRPAAETTEVRAHGFRVEDRPGEIGPFGLHIDVQRPPERVARDRECRSAGGLLPLPFVTEQRRTLLALRLFRDVERGQALFLLQGDVGAGPEKSHQGVRVSKVGGHHQGGPAVLVLAVHVGLRLQDALDGTHVVADRREDERRGVLEVPGFEVGG